MRVRMAQKRMSVKEADLLQYYLEGFDFIRKAVVYERTCDVAVYYKDNTRDAVINKLKKFDYNNLFTILKKRREILKNMTMEQYFNGMINKKLGQFLTKMSGIPKLSKNISELTDNEIKKICTILKKYKIKILDTNGFKNAQVTAGGIPLSEINLENLESKKTKGFYFAGEVMDVYGECGGFNLHWAWASGKFAGENV